ncbi:MAG: OB-fold nucleic acid binding domain-containing protein [Candidatus Woesearchaeota archaeon]|nr:OB-fold nucleic acid binding domain-containing protein [Candidatus Woesearchaeota archaeon]
MIHIPYDQIIEKIKAGTSLSDTDINAKIDEKLNQLSGLISQEGAAHIVANQLGVKLIEKTSGKLQVKNILVGMRDVETVGKVQAVYEVKEFQTQSGSGKVGAFMLADETGIIRTVLWGSQADKLNELSEGVIIKIQNGYVKNNNGRKEVHLNDRSKLIVNPEGESVGEVQEFKSEIVRKKINELQDNDLHAELLGTIVQAYEPRFFEICPTCGRRARPSEDKFVCEQHGSVEPTYSYVMNVFLDDGSDNARIVFFRNQAQQLTGKGHEELLTFKDQPEGFEQIKTDLLGTIIKVVGRVKSNENFGRFDFIAEQVDTKVDPDAEIKRLQAEQGQKVEEPKVEKTEEVVQ